MRTLLNLIVHLIAFIVIYLVFRLDFATLPLSFIFFLFSNITTIVVIGITMAIYSPNLRRGLFMGYIVAFCFDVIYLSGFRFFSPYTLALNFSQSFAAVAIIWGAVALTGYFSEENTQKVITLIQETGIRA